MGVRIEHRQADIDMAQYGALHEELGIGAAEYKLAVKTKAGRGVYTFCMCPGGYVVASASEDGGVCTNGMSLHARDGENANSALLADVRPEDFGSDHPLAGVELQRKYERLAFELGGSDYRAPAQTVGSFLALGGSSRSCHQGTPRHPLTDARGAGTPLAPPLGAALKTESTYRPGIKWADLHECLPDFVSEALEEALPMLGRKLKGFDAPEAVMTGIEARSSSPVRIRRDTEGLALTSQEGSQEEHSPVRGIYPAGEGAGYAGGIMSAAADGYHAAMHIIEKR